MDVECPKCGAQGFWLAEPHFKRDYTRHCLRCGNKFSLTDDNPAIDDDTAAALRLAGSGAEVALREAR